MEGALKGLFTPIISCPVLKPSLISSILLCDPGTLYIPSEYDPYLPVWGGGGLRGEREGLRGGGLRGGGALRWEGSEETTTGRVAGG